MKKMAHWLTRPILLHWLMPYLMALVVTGTVAQKYIGIYDSQRLFFSSFIVWLGPLPLPGNRTVTALLLCSLLTKLILASPWRKATSGIFIAHLGVLMLLLGGLITAASSTEGYVALEKNETASHFFDYHQRILTISQNNKPLMEIPFADIAKGKTITGLPFTLTITNFCRNCTMALRPNADDSFKGSAHKVMLSPLESYMEDERNLSGIEFTIPTVGTYIAFEPMQNQPTFTVGRDAYAITLGRAAYPLPFTLQLLDAEKETHPGTDLPRSYRSTVLLSDGNLHQRAILTMNHPLRYKGYTVYQSSFNGDNATESVSFAIVQNSGRVFPYVASITLCVGLLLHLCMRLPALIRRHNDAI